MVERLEVNCDRPGAVKLDAAPPPGPGDAVQVDVVRHLRIRVWFFRWNSTVSPWRTRMKLPGTVPQTSERVAHALGDLQLRSCTSSSTMTLAGTRGRCRRHLGGLVRIACTGSPCGGPR